MGYNKSEFGTPSISTPLGAGTPEKAKNKVVLTLVY